MHFPRHILVLSLAATSATTIGALIATRFGFQEREFETVHEQWRALEIRPVRGRLAGFGEYRPYRPIASAEPAAEDDDGGVRGEVEPDIGPARLGRIKARATWSLLGGRDSCEPAVALGAAAKSTLGRGNWTIWNDLGVSLLDCVPGGPNATGQTLGQTLEAFEATSHALELDASSKEAHFNRAVILEALSLRRQAQEAWNFYLDEVDGGSGWASEARSRLASLAVVPGGGALGLIERRRVVERDLLPRWSDEVADSGALAAPRLKTQLESAVAGLGSAGSLHAASMAVVARSASEHERSTLLARGHRLFVEGVGHYRAEKTREAHEAFERARRMLEEAGSPFALRAELGRLWAGGKLAPGATEQVLEAAQAQGHLWAAAEATRLLAWQASREGSYSRSLELYKRAKQDFYEVGAGEEAAVVGCLEAQLLMLIDRPEDALAALADALPEIPRMDDAWNRYAALWVSAETVRFVAPEAATAFQREALAACEDLPERPLCRLDLLIALTRASLPRPQAAEILDLAERELAYLEDTEGKERTELDLRLARARLLLRSPTLADASEALDLIAPALAYYDGAGLDVSMAQARMINATAFEVLGQRAQARAQLRAALDHVRQWDAEQRARPERAEAGTPSALRELFERLIALAATEGDAEGAFLFAEEMHNRLAPRFAPATEPPRWESVARALSAMPEASAVIEYTVLAPQPVGRYPTALAWILANGRLEMVEIEGAAELGARLARLHRFGEQERLGAWREESAALWSEWIEPITERLPTDTERILIIPDSELFGVPFRALFDPDSGRYLDEIFTVSLAPSLSMLAESEARGRRPRPSVLSVGFDSFNDRHLRLERAEDEASRVAAAYGPGHEISCPGEDWPALRSCLPRAGVVHLATHAAASSGIARRTWLALPDEDLDLERLWREMPELADTELVVLAACETVAVAGGGEGLGGLARPFLARGARAVIGTLQPIGDEAAHALFPLFHRAFSETGDAAEALQKAREEWIGWESRPWEWGLVEAIVREWS